MKKISLIIFLGLLSFSQVFAQVLSPDEFLGYPLGSKFTLHYRVAEYFKHVAANSKHIKLVEYGRTNEGRPLLAAFVGEPGNIQRLEDIRKNNIAITRNPDAAIAAQQPAIVWLSYNVHGNESSSTESSMKMLYTLVSGKGNGVEGYLKNTLVVIDPCLNPDGRDRYVNFYNSALGAKPNPNPASREHNEPWPGGRSNHYYFDLNRDWAWQTQVESKQRLALYNQWLPQIHVDFHEQGYNEPYYFAPAAEPMHRNISSWQRDFQVDIGKNNAKYFDAEGWRYFTKERFDLLYPSYGDTYPMYNGSIGMTYEKGGIRGGLAVQTRDGEILTLKDRLTHHFTSGLATIETASANHAKLLSQYAAYFKKNLTTGPSAYKSYVVKADNAFRFGKLLNLLDKNGIEYSFGGDKQLKGFNYFSRKEEQFKVERNDLVINVLQPKAVLIDVLFEPTTHVTDSNTYDITAWAMPYAYGLTSYALKESIKGSYSAAESKASNNLVNEAATAWVFDWNNPNALAAVQQLQAQGIKVRKADAAFAAAGKNFAAGTLLIFKSDNLAAHANIGAKVYEILKPFQLGVTPLPSSFVERGKDLGSNTYPALQESKIGIISGAETSSLSFGELWFYLEQDLNVQPLVLTARDMNQLDISKVNTLILPEGRYKEVIGDGLRSWIESGGRLVLIGSAVESFVDQKGFNIKRMAAAKNADTAKNKVQLSKYLAKDDFSEDIPGAIYKMHLDDTHPISFNLGKSYFTVKSDRYLYEPLKGGNVVGIYTPDSYITGVAGDKAKAQLKSGMALGVQRMGRGQVVYIADNPLFRNFWEGGKQLFQNIVFLNY